MNIRQRLELRALINLIVSVLQKVINLCDTAFKKFQPVVTTTLPPKKKPLKKVIDKIIPPSWR